MSIQSSYWTGLDRSRNKIAGLVLNSKNLQRDFINFVGKETIKYLRDITPKSSGATAAAWRIEKQGPKTITISNSNEDILLLIQTGHGGGKKVEAPEGRTFGFDVGGSTFFRTTFTTKRQAPNEFLAGIESIMQAYLDELLKALITKYWPIFRLTSQSPQSVRLRNISKTAGLGQGGKRSTNRGRGGAGVGSRRSGRSGGISVKKLGRRQRRGSFVSSKKWQAKMK